MSVPVIFIAFANANYNADNYLRNLPFESIGLRNILSKAEENSLCEYLIIENITFDLIVQVFQQEKYRDRIAVFHFAGHAGALELFLNDRMGQTQARYKDGLVSFLGSQNSLRFIFLNGCHTEKIAQALTAGGVPAVIGTASSVLDKVASELSLGFYEGLSRGLELAVAWSNAKDRVMSKEANINPINFYRTKDVSREEIALKDQPVIRFPWSLSYSEGREVIQFWSLPQAASNPLFGLPTIDADYDLRNEPFTYLHKYEAQDTRNFFGRADYIRRVYQRLTDHDSAPLLLLYGQSGVGKTALLKAGVIPRLSTVSRIIVLTRTKESGIASDFYTALQDEYLQIIPQGNEQDALAIWRVIEAHSGQKLTFIIDQIEEIFTRPGVEPAKEFGLFVEQLTGIFKQKSTRPQGKLLLSYRKEFHPEVEDFITKTGLPFDSIFVQKLGHRGIEEVVLGIASTPAHRKKYRIEIEQGLPEIIAADLLKDINSPVAPVLQILLSNMWRHTRKSGGQVFSLWTYNQLQNEGIYLVDFFNAQLKALETWSKRESQSLVASGLALDVLNYHTTDFGTSESRTHAALLLNYKHQQEIIPRLLQQLMSLYLLSDTGLGKTTLAHDTLAPLIQQAIKASDKPGQRALRILETKTIDYQLHPEETFLEEEDLAIVEDGAMGMRTWSDSELALLKISQRKRERAITSRKRLRLFIRTIVALLFMAFIGVIYSWQKSINQALGNELISRALQIQDTDPSISRAFIEQAIPLLGSLTMVTQVRHDIFSNNEFYDTLINLGARVNAVSISPDDQHIAVATEKEVQIRDSKEFTLTQTLVHPEAVLDIVYSQDGSLLVSGSADHGVRLWDQEGNLVDSFFLEDVVESFAISKDNSRILVSDRQGQVKLWETDGADLLISDNLGLGVEAVVLSPKDDTIVLGTSMGEIQLRHLDGRLIKSISAHKDRVLSLAANPTGSGFISTSRDATIAYWDQEFQLLTRFVGHKKRVNQGQWLRTQDGILSASDDNTIKLWDLAGKNLKEYRGHSNFITDLAIGHSAAWFASASADSTLRIWRVDSKIDQVLSAPEEGDFTSMAISEDGNLILTGTKVSPSEVLNSTDEFAFFEFEEMEIQNPQNAILWNKKEQSFRKLEGHSGRINSVAIADDGTLFLTGDAEGMTILWNQQGQIIREFSHEAEINCVALSPQKKFILVGASDSLAILWNIAGESNIQLGKHNDLVSSVAFSPDGQRIYTGCYDNLVRVFDLEGRLINTFEGHSNRVSCLAISPDGQQILSGGWDNQIIRWSSTGERLANYFANSKNDTGGQTINALAFSKKMDKIAFAAEGGICRVLNLDGQPLQTMTSTNDDSVTSVLFLPSSDMMVLAKGSSIHFWELLN